MIDVSAAAAQLRLEDGEDALLLQGMIDAAIQRVADWLDRPVYQSGNLALGAPANALEMTPAIERAVLILVARAYDARHGDDDETDLGLPREVHSLLSPYRSFGGVA